MVDWIPVITLTCGGPPDRSRFGPDGLLAVAGIDDYSPHQEPKPRPNLVADAPESSRTLAHFSGSMFGQRIELRREPQQGRSHVRVEPGHGQPGAFVPSPALESTFALS